MVTGSSYLNESGVATVWQAQRDMLATRAAMRGEAALVMYRWNSVSGEHDLTVGPQDVVVSWANLRRSNEQQSATATEQETDGIFTRLEPFDVQVGDTFGLDGKRGKITRVPPVRSNGIAAADFRIDEGTAS